MKIRVLTFLKILRPFSGLATSRLKIFSKHLMVAFVHTLYSTYQFSEESKGGGGNPSPPVLVVPKKRGPERVKETKLQVLLKLDELPK